MAGGIAPVRVAELTEPDAAEPAESLADVIERVGDIPPGRVRMRPYPGTATEQHVIAVNERKLGGLCELVDGVLVYKPMGYFESRLGIVLGRLLDEFAEAHDRGIVLGADGMVRVEPGQVRIPDVCFFGWERFPDRLLPRGAILGMTPDFAIEILSPTNTRREMERKRREYFAGGARLVWEADPDAMRVRVYGAADQFIDVGEDGTLDGGAVLPGFSLSVRSWFERAGRRRPEGT